MPNLYNMKLYKYLLLAGFVFFLRMEYRMNAISNVQPQVKAVSQTVLCFGLGVLLSALSGVMLLLAFSPGEQTHKK